jgi:hypothetical protein
MNKESQLYFWMTKYHFSFGNGGRDFITVLALCGLTQLGTGVGFLPLICFCLMIMVIRNRKNDILSPKYIIIGFIYLYFR